MDALQTTLDETLGPARVRYRAGELRVETGRVRRTWRWTGRGLLTVSVERQPEGMRWTLDMPDETAGADWLLPTVESANPPAELMAVTCEVSDDDGFTSRHLAMAAEMVYAEARLAVRFVAWVYPDAPGIRTQMFVRGLDGFDWPTDLHRTETSDRSLRIARLNRGMARVDRVPCDLAGIRRRYIGYCGDSQQRNDTFTWLLKEHVAERRIVALETCDWASVAMLESGGEALTLVKESHKRPNAPGHDTGIFRCRPGVGVENLGWGVLPGEIGPDWTPAWPDWCLAHGSDPVARETALKTMDRVRYPVRPQDVFVQSNTWGSSMGFLQSRDAAAESSVLAELDAAHDLGVDLVQIDDGWQGDDYSQWVPCVKRYPEGWGPVRQRADQLRLRLGLWASVSPRHGIPLEDLKRTFDEGGFAWYKLDFAHLYDRQLIEDVVAKARGLLRHTGHAARVNWDDTEGRGRFGTWFAREYGAIYPANRKPVLPRTTTYRPHTILRDLWEAAKYLNLVKFLGPVQNVDRVDPLFSDAVHYSHDYCVAITLFSLPTFFQELKLYDEPARACIRPLLALHRRYREKIRQGITYPVGAMPDGASWTGLQNHRADEASGLLLLFRELANESDTASLALRFAAGRSIRFTDLVRQRSWNGQADEDGQVAFRMPDAPAFRFLAYRFVS